MNKKGIFSSIIAVCAVMLIAAAVITMQATVQANSQDTAQKIVEVKSEWNNARYLLDKATTYAIAQESTACAVQIPSEAKMQAYFESALGKIPNCSLVEYNGKIVSIIPAGNKTTVETVLACAKQAGSFSFNIAKKVKIEKEATVVAPCIQIKDLQSGIVEVP